MTHNWQVGDVFSLMNFKERYVVVDLNDTKHANWNIEARELFQPYDKHTSEHFTYDAGLKFLGRVADLERWDLK